MIAVANADPVKAGNQVVETIGGHIFVAADIIFKRRACTRGMNYYLTTPVAAKQ